MANTKYLPLEIEVKRSKEDGKVSYVAKVTFQSTLEIDANVETTQKGKTPFVVRGEIADQVSKALLSKINTYHNDKVQVKLIIKKTFIEKVKSIFKRGQ